MEKDLATPPLHPKKRRWISGIGWLSMIAGVLIAANSAFSIWVWWRLKSEYPETQGLPIPPESMALMPPQFQTYFRYFAVGHAFFGIFAIFQTVAGFGLLNRREWGRLSMVIALWITIVLHLAGIPMTFAMRDLIYSTPMPPNADPELVYKITAGLSFAYIGATILVCWLLACKLGKPDVRGEFTVRQGVPTDTGLASPGPR